LIGGIKRRLGSLRARQMWRGGDQGNSGKQQERAAHGLSLNLIFWSDGQAWAAFLGFSFIAAG